MFRLTWGRLGGSVTRRKTTAAAKATTAAVSPSRNAHAKSKQHGSTSKSGGRTSRTSSTTRMRSSPCTKSPIARKKSVDASAEPRSKKENARVAKESGASSSVSSSLQAKKDEAHKYAPARPAYMSPEREEEVLAMAERMQRRDLTTEVPVASFAYEILKAHPSVRNMGLRERMDFLLKRWAQLSKSKRLEYINNPLRGLL